MSTEQLGELTGRTMKLLMEPEETTMTTEYKAEAWDNWCKELQEDKELSDMIIKHQLGIKSVQEGNRRMIMTTTDGVHIYDPEQTVYGETTIRPAKEANPTLNWFSTPKARTEWITLNTKLFSVAQLRKSIYLSGRGYIELERIAKEIINQNK